MTYMTHSCHFNNNCKMVVESHDFIFCREAKEQKLVKRDARWTFVFQDWEWNTFPTEIINSKATFITMQAPDQCCIVNNKKGALI